MRLFFITGMLGVSLLAQTRANLAAADTSLQSPAEKKIATAKAAIAKNPKFAEAWANLALALSMRARETSNTAFYDEGLRAVDQGFAVDKTSFAVLKSQCWILLGKHEFAQALGLAKELSKRSGDDLMVYGFLSDANTELGNYKDAEHATQWMLDLRPGNTPALTRAAHLREIFGDPEGALELLQMASLQLGAAESENRAWIVVQMAHLRLAQGAVDDAERLARQALEMYPDYHYALGELARIRRAQKRYPEAVTLERKRIESAPHAENRFTLAQSLWLAGNRQEAREAFAAFERSALAEKDQADNANHELIAYYVDYARRPQEALKVARLELTRRQDFHTLAAYAWALHAAAQHSQARKQMQRALSVGVKDAELFRHAAEISLALKDTESARAYQAKAAELRPRTESARGLSAAGN
ncbi:MAG: tetratricopeptide repeat protein [Bryobacteraceae bacterium]|nr:tetratricopeptide repeat protein [Bryobacteraceae bacterium]